MKRPFINGFEACQNIRIPAFPGIYERADSPVHEVYYLLGWGIFGTFLVNYILVNNKNWTVIKLGIVL